MKRKQVKSKEEQTWFPCRNTEVVWKEVGGRGILLDLQDGGYFEVGGIGLEVWKRCDGKVSFRTLVERLGGKFGVPSKRVERDLLGFLSDLKRRGLVEWR